MTVIESPSTGSTRATKRPRISSTDQACDEPQQTTPQGIAMVQRPISPEAFFQTYVATRTPCLLVGAAAVAALAAVPTKSDTNTRIKWATKKSSHKEGTEDTSEDKKSNLVGLEEVSQILGPDRVVQVEVRKTSQTQAGAAVTSFGQNRKQDETQTNLTINEFCQALRDPVNRSKYYLSTQQSYAEDQGTTNAQADDDSKDGRGPMLFSPLTQALVDDSCIPKSLPLSGNLLLQTCQLWMGAAAGTAPPTNVESLSSSNATHSGLHHDFHDNLYWVVQGHKRWWIAPPSSDIPLHGVVDKIHSNGLISYQSNPTRSDGVPLAILDDDSEEDEADDGDLFGPASKDQETKKTGAEILLGQGFDYQSDDEEDNEAFENMDETKDDFDELVGGEDDEEDTDNLEEEEEDPDSKRPDHFSPVDLSSSALYEDYPSIRTVKSMEVHVRAGEILYLPASWFHCVWSSCEISEKTQTAPTEASSDEFHLAINYWYHPPDQLESFANPYKHDYWAKKQTRMS